jgi:Fungal specific transcription factor domain
VASASSTERRSQQRIEPDLGLEGVDNDIPPSATEAPGSMAIPQTLSGLPEIVLASPRLMFLWSHFVHMTTKMFLCWDPVATGLDRYTDPYTVLLPAMAVGSKPLMLASLALSAFQYSSAKGDDRMQAYAAQLSLGASWALTKTDSIASNGSSHWLTATVAAVFLSLLDSNTYPKALPFARHSTACLINSNAIARLDQDAWAIAIHMVKWLDICSQCSLRGDILQSNDAIHRLIETEPPVLKSATSEACKDWFVDPLFGFSRRMINPLLRLSRLVRKRQILEDIAPERSPPGDSGVSDFEREVDELEESLLAFRDADLEFTQGNSKIDIDLVYLNEATYSTATILFYTRLRDLPWTAAFVRRQVKTTYETINRIKPGSRVSLGIVFPLFVAGCEAVDIVAREAIINRLGSLPGYWRGREESLTASLRKVWRLRDTQPETPWRYWANKSSYFNKSCSIIKFLIVTQ